MEISEKLQLMRESERMNRMQFADFTGIPYRTLYGYEAKGKEMSVTAVQKLFADPRFGKYMMWFLTDQTSPETGQIAPALAHFGQENQDSHHSDQKTG